MDFLCKFATETDFLNFLVTSFPDKDKEITHDKMVCIPCFIVPVLLYIWHRFLQPYVLRYWNPWAKKDADGNVINTPENTKFPIDCTGGQCIFKGKGRSNATDAKEPDDSQTASVNPHLIATDQSIDKKNE